MGFEIISLSPADPPVLLSTVEEKILLERTDWIFFRGSLLCYKHRDSIIVVDSAQPLWYDWWIDVLDSVSVSVCLHASEGG